MENQTDTTPIIFCVKRTRYRNSKPIISWTSKFAESVRIRYLTRLPTKQLKLSNETRETMTSIFELKPASSESSFVGLQPYTGNPSGEGDFSLKFQCYTSSEDLKLVNSTNIFLDPGGGIEDNATLSNNNPHLDYAIHCCVRPTLRCCVNDLPVEILEIIFSSFEYHLSHSTSKLSKVIPLVCKLWNKIFNAFEPDPFTAKMKVAKLKRFPGKRFMWNTCYYDPSDDIDFHEYFDAVVEFQPFLEEIVINRPLRDSPLSSLLIFAKVPTLAKVTLSLWNYKEVLDFLQARQHFRLDYLKIEKLVEGHKESTSSMSMNPQSQFIRVTYLTIYEFDNSIHKILDSLQKNYIQYLRLWYDPATFEPLKEPIQLFGYENLISLALYGGNDESNLVSFDFISKTCTPSNLPKLYILYLEYCFIDPTQVRYLLHMPKLKNADIILFLGQKTLQNEHITVEVMKKLMSKHKHENGEFIIHYSDACDRL